MPILKHAKKALRVSQRKAVYNQRVRSSARTAIKKMRQQPKKNHLQLAYQAIDRAVKRHLWQANKAARLKSQLAKLLK